MTSHVVGCVLGGAIGDALGEQVEFKSLAEIFREISEDGVRNYPSTGARFTDDTQMTLFTMAGWLDAVTSYGSSVSTILKQIKNAYFAWGSTQGLTTPFIEERNVQEVFTVVDKQGWRAPGQTCLNETNLGLRGTMSNKINNSKGCGGVMRVGPLGFVNDGRILAAESAAMTHTHPSGYIAAAALAHIVDQVSRGEPLRGVVESLIDDYAGEAEANEVRFSLLSALRLSLAWDGSFGATETLGGGWVAEEALAIAVFACLVSDSFEQTIAVAVTHGGDSDSTGAIAGNVWGATYGIGSIPEALVENVEEREFLLQFATKLAKRVEVQRGN